MIEFKRLRNLFLYVIKVVMQGFSVKIINNSTSANKIELSVSVVYLKSGGASIKLKNKTVTISPLQAAVIAPYTPHSIQLLDNSECYLLSCPYSFSSELYFTPSKLSLGVYTFSLSTQTADYVEFLIKNVDSLSEHSAKSLYYAITSDFYNNEVQNNQNDDFLRRIVDVVRSGNVENITIKEISIRLGVGKIFLLSYLKNHVDVNFKDFVNDILVGKSIELLSNADLSITQVAARSGFGSIRTFNRVFLNKLGYTPSQYRKKFFE
jgi:YesN/AraC family two-component response regulator